MIQVLLDIDNEGFVIITVQLSMRLLLLEIMPCPRLRIDY